MSERWVPVRSPDEVRPGVTLKLQGSVTAIAVVGRRLSKAVCLPCYCWSERWQLHGTRWTYSCIKCMEEAIEDGNVLRLETGLDEAADRAEGKELYNGVPARKERVK